MTEHFRAGEITGDEPLKTLDREFRYRGYYDREPEGLARVRVFRRGSLPPVLLITDLPENPTTSVTNLIDTLVPELLRELMPERFEHLEPAVVVEHLPATTPEPGRPLREYRREDQYSRVSFESWAPRKIWLGGRERLSLGQPEWTHLPREEVAELIGEHELTQDYGEEGRRMPKT